MFKYDQGPQDETSREINHDILFREGETRRGEVTFTPRLILAELKGGLGSLKPSGVLYEDEDADCEKNELCWDGSVAVHKEQVKKKNLFLNFIENGNHCNNGHDKRDLNYHMESQINVWSDYLRPYLHPKSVTIIKEYSHMSENNPFDLWMKGADLKNVSEELEERIRFYAEECDHLQGFYVISDINNGFSGLSSAVSSYLCDEFSSKHSVIFPGKPTHFADDSKLARQKRELTCSLGLSTLLEYSSVICPLSLSSDPALTPHLIYDASMNYHTSAIFASALDTATLNHRLKNADMNLEEFCCSNTSISKNIVSLSLLLPIPLLNHLHPTSLKTSSSCLSELLQTNFRSSHWTELSPNMDVHTSNSVEYYAQMMNSRGMPSTKCSAVKGSQHTFCQGDNTKDMLLLYLKQRCAGCQNSAFSFDDPLPTQVPFPQIFSERVGRDGFLEPAAYEQISTVKAWLPRTVSTSSNGHDKDHNSNNNHEDCLRQVRNGHGGDGDRAMNDLNHDTMTGRKFPYSPIKRVRVDSVPVMTNLTCSSKSERYLRIASNCLREGRKRHFMFHGMELENVDNEIERLYTFRDEYKNSLGCDSSDIDDF